MKRTIKKYDNLATKILAALTLLDEKGTDEKVTLAMSIVYEAFRLRAAKRSFSANDLFVSAKSHCRDEMP